jgi:hypothetical protein
MSRSIFQWTAWKRSRRAVLFTLFGSVLAASNREGQSPEQEQIPDDRRPKFPDINDEPRLPDGKSQKNAIAKEQHDQALKEAEQLVTEAQQLRDELRRAGTFVVSVSSVKKTEDIERLAKRIRGRLKS